jgi:pro-kumamolisin-like protein
MKPPVVVASLLSVALTGATVLPGHAGSTFVHVAAVIACKNDDGLDRLISAQTDPRSPLFHRYLTPAQYAGVYAPSATNYTRVILALRAAGLRPVRTDPMHTVVDLTGDAAALAHVPAEAAIGSCSVALVEPRGSATVDAYVGGLRSGLRAQPVDRLFPDDRGYQTAAGLLARQAAALGLGDSTNVAFSGVLTWHDDLARTGENLHETVLTRANVNARQFGKRYARPVDGMIYAQPLYLKAVSVPGSGTLDVVYVATEHDGVYAFDASGRRRSPLWRDSFIDPAHGITTMPCTSPSQPECDPTILVPEHGITATPVIDELTGTMFVVA